MKLVEIKMAILEMLQLFENEMGSLSLSTFAIFCILIAVAQIISLWAIGDRK